MNEADDEVVALLPDGGKRTPPLGLLGIDLVEGVLLGREELDEEHSGVRRLEHLCKGVGEQVVGRKRHLHTEIVQRIARRSGMDEGGHRKMRSAFAKQDYGDEHVAVSRTRDESVLGLLRACSAEGVPAGGVTADEVASGRTVAGSTSATSTTL